MADHPHCYKCTSYFSSKFVWLELLDFGSSISSDCLNIETSGTKLVSHVDMYQPWSSNL